MGDTKLIINGEDRERERETLQLLRDLATHLLAKDYLAAKASQQALLNYRDVFQVHNRRVGLAKVLPTSGNSYNR